MNFNRRIALSLALVSLIGLTAAGASAQTVSKGTFTLPEKTYWSNSVLPAGDYTMQVSKGPWATELITLHGEGVSASFFAPAGYEVTSGRACLKLEEINGSYVVRELDDSVFGRAYTFSVPKAAKEAVLHGSVRRPVTVAISADASLSIGHAR